MDSICSGTGNSESISLFEVLQKQPPASQSLWTFDILPLFPAATVANVLISEYLGVLDNCFYHKKKKNQNKNENVDWNKNLFL